MTALKVIIDDVEYRPCVPPVPISDHTLDQLLRVYRKSYGWTLDEAAEKIGCSKSYLHGMESGANEPSLRMALQISNAYNLSMKRMALALPEEIK